MNSPINVSIIVAAHNAALTLDKTLRSVCEQSFPHWEVIIVDDGSTDTTTMVAEHYAAQDDRFKIFSQANAGVSAARNMGIAKAYFDWLLFLDADDWILPQHLEMMTDRLRQDDQLDAAYCGWAFITPDNHYVFQEIPWQTGDLFAIHVDECPYAIHAYVVRRELIEAVGGFQPGLITCEDWDLWQRFARTGARFGAVPHMLAPYRMRAHSASMDGRRILADGLRVLQQAHTTDDRVPIPHPVYRNGLPADHLALKKYYLVCSAAGLIIGRNEDARPVLEVIDSEVCEPLDPIGIVDCIVQASMLSACRPLKEWKVCWDEIEDKANLFLKALENASGCRRLAGPGHRIARNIVQINMSTLGPWHRAKAIFSHLSMLPIKIKHGEKSKLKAALGSGKRWAFVNLQMFPKWEQRLRALRRHFLSKEDVGYFEELYGQQVDPWGYTSDYEQTKYLQTLQLIPDEFVQDALELACAEGHFTQQLAPRVGKLLASDVSKTSLARTAERCRRFDNIRYQKLNFFKENIPGPFDLIVCSEVLYFAGTKRRLNRIANKIARALKPDGHLIMAHGNVVIDEPESPGFNWDHDFGAKGIGGIFQQQSSLVFEKEIRTPLYRVQRFRRIDQMDQEIDSKGPEIIEMSQPTKLTPEVEDQVLWKGCADQLPILMYHRVADCGSNKLSPWRINLKAFEDQLCYLKNNGIESITLSDWRAWRNHRVPLPRGSVLLTFDDGYRDFLQNAWPLLQQYGFSAIVYLVADLIGNTNQWDQSYEKIELLSWREIRRLQAEGLSFGSHAASHTALTALSLRHAKQELRRSKDILEQGLGIGVDSIAYPFGEYSAAIQYLAGLAGYDFGLTCERGPCTIDDSLLALPRIEVEGTDTVQSFAAKLANFGVKY